MPLASFRLIVLFLAGSLLASSLSAQRRGDSSPLDTVGREEQDEARGREALETFRSMGIAGDYRFQFQLELRPKQGETRRVPGVLLGSSNELGPVSRVDVILEDASFDAEGKSQPAKVKRLLLQNGPRYFAYEMDAFAPDAVASLVPTARYFEPIAGSDVSIFDLLMPYVYWQQYRYEGRLKRKSQPTHVYWMFPPEGDEALTRRLSGVRIYINEEFNIMYDAEFFGPEGHKIKNLEVGAPKKVDGQWFPKLIDIRNEVTRDKTRFEVEHAEMGVVLPRLIFTPEGLEQGVIGTALGY